MCCRSEHILYDTQYKKSHIYTFWILGTLVYTEIKIQSCVPETYNVVNQGYLPQSHVFLGLLYNF